MKDRTCDGQIAAYNEKYGAIPLEKDEILEYLKDALQLKEKDFLKIQKDNEHAAQIPWRVLKIILPIVPNPSPRPRYSSKTGSFYVMGASENKKILKKFINEKYKIIYTQTYFSVRTFIPTPISSMSRVEVYRAEMQTITPTTNPDWDNLGKTYSDMVQKILITNDNIISKGLVEKFYSVKPRVEIMIKYQRGFDSRYNERRILKSKSFMDAVELGHIIEVYTEEDTYWSKK